MSAEDELARQRLSVLELARGGQQRAEGTLTLKASCNQYPAPGHDPDQANPAQVICMSE